VALKRLLKEYENGIFRKRIGKKVFVGNWEIGTGIRG
jgi:hypothetical protein